ncbi:hypothetical protein KI387_012496 [Taxus chinensis]|uniref:Mitochondrial carrier protein n=1 Tax=Taxus chinensis TaxID=29808 RepID=A0AA38CL29_TAXCH|nr:hypothetical protein KI387_012496 [Taxus chinensis]
MEFWPEFLASSWGREFVAGGFGGMAGVVAGHPLDTLRIRLQQPRVMNDTRPSALKMVQNIVTKEGPSALYKGMGLPLAAVAFQNAVAFQAYALLSRAIDHSNEGNEPPSYKSVALAGIGAGTIQTAILTPVELIKIQLQVNTARRPTSIRDNFGPIKVAKGIVQREGLKGLYRGLGITVLRDAPAHGVYFWTYEYSREWLHPGCRKNSQESLSTMLAAGGCAGVASWIFCYPLDVVKSRLQAQGNASPKYTGILDCLQKSVREEGFKVLWRGLGTAVARAFVVNGAIFAAYETALRFFNPQTDDHALDTAVKLS